MVVDKNRHGDVLVECVDALRKTKRKQVEMSKKVTHTQTCFLKKMRTVI